MENRHEKLHLFFERIKTLTFWQRVFSWKSLKSLSYEAYEEFRSLVASLDRSSRELEQSNNTISILQNDNEHLNEKIKQTERRVTDQEKEIALLKDKASQLTQDITQLRQENTVFKQTDNDRRTKYEKDVATLNNVTERIQNERKQEKEELQRAEIHRIESMKETWARHQENVKSFIKRICQRHVVDYVDKVPFKGTPDNTIKIADEYIVFDAKSPGSDDLQKFPNYIRSQTEAVKKYVNEENVRKDVFLVIPSNTVDVIKQFSFNMADYNVYIVTIDVLEPLILSLKRIEEYEFVDQLSLEERENICRIVGKFAHIAKRRIQIDHFFAWEFLDVLTKCKADLPKEVLEKVIEFEKAEKLNPPQERRSKQILTKDLQSDSEKIQREAEAKAIQFPPSLKTDLKNLPLYEGEQSDSTDST